MARIVKIILALLVVHGVARVGIAYWSCYQFEDNLMTIARVSERRGDKQLCDEAMEAAAADGVPITAAGLTIRRGGKPSFNCESGSQAVEAGRGALATTQMVIEGVYVDQVAILPGYMYAWEFRPTTGKVLTRLY